MEKSKNVRKNIVIHVNNTKKEILYVYLRHCTHEDDLKDHTENMLEMYESTITNNKPLTFISEGNYAIIPLSSIYCTNTVFIMF